MAQGLYRMAGQKGKIMEGHEEYMKRMAKEVDQTNSAIIQKVDVLASLDTLKLNEAEQSYGDSWKQRGGVGAFMMLARKWDRLEKQVTEHHYDVFHAIEQDAREEGIIDDIRDLRRYLFLVEAEIALRKTDGSGKPK